MIVSKIFSGLGNQLFQYAAGRQLAKRNHVSLWLDTQSFKNDPLRRYELGGFHINCNILQQDRLPIKERLLKRLSFNNRTLKKYTDPIWELDHQLLEEKSNNCYLSGYWAWPQYFREVHAEIRKEITLQVPLEKLAPKWVALAARPGSVALHIRRADYVDSSAASNFFGALDLSYYQSAIQYISQQVPHAHFLLFSDDLAWVEKEFIPAVDLPAYEFVQDDTLATPAQEMILMSYCQHQVMANSTFSWWGAWLNTNPGKICIQPARWYKDEAAQEAYEKGILNLPGSIKL